MTSSRQQTSGGYYTHFIPKPPDEVAQTSNPNPWFYPIYECNCTETMSRDLRQIIEGKLLKKVRSVFDKKKSLVLYSFGSGSCYQELSFCVKLAEKGHDVRQIVLVDNEYKAGTQQELAVKQFGVFAKLLFPSVQISAYKEETDYLEEVKNLKQEKPDIILCIDVPLANLSSKKAAYSKMLESSNSQCVFAYHNSNNPFNSSSGTSTDIETVQGSSS